MSSTIFGGKMTSTSGETKKQGNKSNVSSNLKAAASHEKNTITVDVIADGRVSPFEAVIDTVRGAETVGGGRTDSAIDEDSNLLSSCSQDIPMVVINSNQDGKTAPPDKNRLTGKPYTSSMSTVKNVKQTNTNNKPKKKVVIHSKTKKTVTSSSSKQTKVKVVDDDKDDECRSSFLPNGTDGVDDVVVLNNDNNNDNEKDETDRKPMSAISRNKVGIRIDSRMDDSSVYNNTKDNVVVKEEKTKKKSRGEAKRTKNSFTGTYGFIGSACASVMPLVSGLPVGQRYEDYYTVKERDEEEFGKKPKWVVNRLKYYMRGMGCGASNQIVSMEGKLPVVVFGATGVIGGSVVRALLKDPRFSVKAVTRTPTTDQARALAEIGAVVVPADLNDVRSLQRVMEGVAGVFLTTNFWEHLSKQKELTHGMNAVDAAVSCNVHHFILQGSDHTREQDKPCGHMNAKAAIEEYIKETSIPYTSIRMPFLYENLLSLFKPHCVEPGLYTLPIPMGDVAMDCMALHDFARCVVNIFLRPKNHMLKSVELTGDRMTVQHMADVFNRHFDDRKFVYHKINPEDFSHFDFQGCQDLAALFEYMQSAPHRDPRITRRIHHSVVCFDKWVSDNKQALVDAMKDTGDDVS